MKSLALTIFGITSNLSQKYLLPALYDMAEKDILPPNLHVIGNARSPMTKEQLTNFVIEVLNKPNVHHKHAIKPEAVEKLLRRFHYLEGQLDDSGFYIRLNELLKNLKIDNKQSFSSNKIFYLATYPELYHHIFENLQRVGLNNQSKGFVRLMIEKPIGNDLKSAQDLNQLLLTYFEENQIYRLDHYLGKETLQNILAFRFTNGIFEPLIDKEYIDHIQITASEDFGIGTRGGYYDQVGALIDVGQNHLLQMLAFATMDAPTEFSSEAVTSQRIKILQNLKADPKNIVFGQYEGYRQEKNVNPNSLMDTFYALKTYIDNERFKDIPIYIRAGKNLAQSVAEISIVFKTPKNRLFKNMKVTEEPNILIYRIQPNEGIVLKVLTKVPGHDIKLSPEYMQYCYKQSLRSKDLSIDPYSPYFPNPHERLLVDTIRGDHTFFNDSKEVEAQWKFVDSLISSRKKPHVYKVGSWGPEEANKLIKNDGREWLEPSMDFCRI